MTEHDPSTTAPTDGGVAAQGVRDDVRERAAAIVAGMSVAERAGQLVQLFVIGEDPEQVADVEATIARGGVGSLLFVTDPAETNRLQALVRAGSSHGLGALFGYDVVHGLRTILPVPIALAASFDPGLAEAGAAVAAREARAVGLHWTFAPMVDVARDPRWGRIVEGAGEDPCLGAAMAAAQVRGFQGERSADGSLADDRVLAGPKHFIAYGAAVGGRDYEEVDVSDAALHDVYLPPFAAAIEAGAANVMTAYMDVNGVPATGNALLLGELLRGELGFEGFTVSDANAVRSLVEHGFAADLPDAAARAVGVGVDLEMAFAEPAYAHLADLVASGVVDGALLEASARRVVEAKLRLGLDRDPTVDVEAAQRVLSDPSHREVARTAAARSAVLLRNEGATLPLDASAAGPIAVLGPLADDARATLGPWCFAFDLDETVTVLSGIRARAAGVQVQHAPGVRPAQRGTPSIFDRFPGNQPADPPGFDDDAELARAVGLAAASAVAVVVVGEWQNQVGEQASRSTLDLPGRQLELLAAVVATGTPTVAVVMSGRPLDLRWADENVPAILQVWYPGTAGGAAVADLLFGDVSPAARLPFTWPRSVGQVPTYYARTTSQDPENAGQRYWDEPSTPLYPFGHGLSYSTFSYADLRVDRPSVGLEDSVTVTATVTNTGAVDADEVVQLYLHQRHGTASRPVRELKGFERVTVAAGASTEVAFTVGPQHRRYWNAVARGPVLDPSTFDVWVGGSSTADLATSFTVEAG